MELLFDRPAMGGAPGAADAVGEKNSPELVEESTLRLLRAVGCRAVLSGFPEDVSASSDSDDPSGAAE